MFIPLNHTAEGYQLLVVVEKAQECQQGNVAAQKQKNVRIASSTVWNMDMVDASPTLHNPRLPPRAAPTPASAHTPNNKRRFRRSAGDRSPRSLKSPRYRVCLLTSGVLKFDGSKRAVLGDRSCSLGSTGGEGEGRPLIDTGDSRKRLPPTKPRVSASLTPATPSLRGAAGGGSGLFLLNTRPPFPRHRRQCFYACRAFGGP